VRAKRNSHATWKAQSRLWHDGVKCYHCAVPLRLRAYARDLGSDTPEVDHLVPLALGGTDDDANLVLSCLRCNRSKGGRAA